MKIIVTGAAGRTARLLTPLLVERGHSVTGTIRRSTEEADLKKGGVDPAVVDLAKASVDDYKKLFSGADVVLWTAGGNSSIDRDATIRGAEATGLAGVPRFVLMSTMGAGMWYVPGMGPYLRAKGDADKYVVASNAYDWTVVRPGWLSDKPAVGKFSIRRPGFLSMGPIPRADAAAILAEVVDQPEATRNVMFGVVNGEASATDAVGSLKGSTPK